MAPRVSVVTTVYNFEDIVLETVHSILNQTYRDLELIVVDDGSTDRSADLVEAVGDPRLKLIRAEHVGLPAAGLSRAYENSRGELVAVTGADDVWLPNKVERQVEFFDGHPTVGVVHTGFNKLIDGHVYEQPVRSDEPEVIDGPAALERLISTNFICTPSTMLRRTAVERVGVLFDTDPLLCGPEDYDLWLRLSEVETEFGYIHEPLVNYRIRGTSVSRAYIRNYLGNLRAFEKALARRPELYDRHRRLVRRRLSSIYRQLGRMRLVEGKPGGLADEWQAIKLSPASLRSWGWLFVGLGGKHFARGLLAARDVAASVAGRPGGAKG
jgi:glycosyltransferase involved in cell wall biosynthesis